MNHTKGPWNIETHMNGKEIWSNNTCIVTMDPNISMSNIDNNFKLISAAPELLEALKVAIRLIATAENNGAYKDCALPLYGKKSLEKMESLLERLG